MYYDFFKSNFCVIGLLMHAIFKIFVSTRMPSVQTWNIFFSYSGWRAKWSIWNSWMQLRMRQQAEI